MGPILFRSCFFDFTVKAYFGFHVRFSYKILGFCGLETNLLSHSAIPQKTSQKNRKTTGPLSSEHPLRWAASQSWPFLIICRA